MCTHADATHTPPRPPPLHHTHCHIAGYYPVTDEAATRAWRISRGADTHTHTLAHGSGFHPGWNAAYSHSPPQTLRRSLPRTPHGARVDYYTSLKRCSNTRSTSVALMLPSAFEDSMIHGVLRFTLRFAFRCVLHRCENQDIRCPQLFEVVCLIRRARP